MNIRWRYKCTKLMNSQLWKKGIKYCRGHVLPYGATVLYSGVVNSSVSSKDTAYAELLIYHLGDREPFVINPFPDEFRIGSIFTMMVFDLDIENIEYGYRFDGPYNPEIGLIRIRFF